MEVGLMDFSKALTYPFDDPDWAKKLAIPAGISFVLLIFGFGGAFFPPVLLCMFPLLIAVIPLVGWQLETMKNVRNNVANPMANWDDFGGLFRKGLTPFLAAIVYQIPPLLILCLAASGITLSVLGVSGLQDVSDDVGAALGGLFFFIIICGTCLIVMYSIVANIVYWGGFMRYLEKEEFSTFMQVGENIAIIRNNMSDFLMAVLFTLIGGVIANAIGVAVPCVGWAATLPFQFYFNSHIMGQLAAKLAGTAAPKPMM